MADNSTGTPVQTLTGQFVQTKIVDSAGTNVAAVSAAGRVSVDASGVAVPVTDNSGSLTTDFLGQYVGDAAATSTPNGTMAMALANAAAPAGVSADNDAVAIWALRNGSPVVNLASGGTLITIGQKAMASSIPVVIASDQSAIAVTGSLGGTQYVGDAAATATPTGTMGMGLANAAAPTDVSANNDAVAAWMLRNGAQVVNLASGGTLITIGSKTSANSIPVVIASDQAALPGQYVGDAAATATPTGMMAMGLAHAAAPADVSADNDAVAAWMLRNGSPVVNIAAGGTLLTNIGQTAATSTFVRINDGTTTAGVIVGTTALKTDMSSIVGTVPGATNPLPVRLTDGAAFYSAGSAAPTLPKFSTKTSAALGAGASVDLTHYVTSGKTGQLVGIDAGSSVPLKVVINTELTAAKTTRVVLFTKPYETYQWRSPFKTYITQASADATSGFSVTIKNMDASVAADVYSTGYWDEV